MPITKVPGFAHLALMGTDDYNVGYGLGLSEYKVVCGRGSNVPPVTYMPYSGRLAFMRNSLAGAAAAHGIATIPLKAFFGNYDPSTFKKFILGMRYEIALVPNNDIPIVGFTLSDVLNASGTGYAADDPIALYLRTTGKTGISYLELVFDLTAKTLALYQDTVLVNTLTLPDRHVTGFADLMLFAGRKDVTYLSSTSASTETKLVFFDNMYAIADTGDTSDAYRTRLGPVVVDRLPVTAVDGTWTASSGTALAAITTDRTASNNQTPNAIAANDGSAASLTIDTSAFRGARKLLAISGSIGAFLASGESGNLDVQWTSSEGDRPRQQLAALPVMASSSTLLKEQNLPINNALPAQANLGSLRLKLLPR